MCRKLAAFGTLIFLIAAAVSFYLLFIGKFSGAEFTAFIVAFTILALAVGFAPEIQEVSIAGNVLKLREVKAEAVAAIESLNESRVEMLGVFLSLALKHSGGFASGEPVDPRNYHFWNLVDLSRKYKCLHSLRAQIGKSLHVLMVAQIRQLQNRNDDASGLDTLPMPTAFELSEKVLSPKGLDKAEARCKKDLKSEIHVGLEEYLKLDQLREELQISRQTMQPI